MAWCIALMWKRLGDAVVALRSLDLPRLARDSSSQSRRVWVYSRNAIRVLGDAFAAAAAAAPATGAARCGRTVLGVGRGPDQRRGRQQGNIRRSPATRRWHGRNPRWRPPWGRGFFRAPASRDGQCSTWSPIFARASLSAWEASSGKSPLPVGQGAGRFRSAYVRAAWRISSDEGSCISHSPDVGRP